MGCYHATTFVLTLFASNFGSIAQDAVQLKAPVVWLLKCQDSPPVTREEVVAFEINYFRTGAKWFVLTAVNGKSWSDRIIDSSSP